MAPARQGRRRDKARMVIPSITLGYLQIVRNKNRVTARPSPANPERRSAGDDGWCPAAVSVEGEAGRSEVFREGGAGEIGKFVGAGLVDRIDPPQRLVDMAGMDHDEGGVRQP